ncbi:MAG: hypothetical protein GY863_11500, partial [bacterium]|nr:hypothetical protein [bacterium]
ILVLDEEVSFTDVKGKKRNMNSQDLDDIINRIEILPNGKIRAIASKYIEGGMLGPFKYYKTRKDDPNDYIPHNYRRELRGMRILAAWLGHYDTKANNSYDAYITDENGNNYVRHYMMDFGSTLGSQSSAPKQPFIGFENQFDTKAIFMNIITLGLYVRPYEKFDYDDFYPSIGRFTSEYFHPQRYKFIFPNPAFESMTDIDGYWGARLVMSFTDEQIRAVVESAQYTNDEAREYLMKTLIERRDIAGRYWFDKMPPLDYFAVSSGSGSRTLSFKDLAIDTGLESTNGTTYKYEILDQKKNILNSGEIKPGMNIALPEINLSGEDQYIITRLNIKRDGANIWSKGISVYLTGGDNGGWKLIGVRR